MKSHLSTALAEELEKLKALCLERPFTPGQTRSTANRNAFNRVVAGTAGVLKYLANAPYSPGKEIAEQMGMDKNELKLSYKLIQRTNAATDFLKASPNGDYLNIVKHYFTNQMYVVVFFVGLACPGRCSFCPNVTVHSDGTRQISLYPGGKSNCISPREIESMFKDMSQLQEQGAFVLVKISGGLEPMTDTGTMSAIIKQAHTGKIRTKLFTNGLLLDTDERRHLALGAGDVRISLSMIDAAAYGEVMFGRDTTRKNKYGLASLLGNIRKLVHERDYRNSGTHIGINCIVLEENHREIPRFINLAQELGVDYIDFKPNYFSPYKKTTQACIKKTIEALKENTDSSPRVYFAGSLSAKNLFWTHRNGVCPPHKQSWFKLFITPHGNCSPVHYGAFPSVGQGVKNKESIYTGGRISPKCSLLDIIANMPALPDLEYEKLNPFEHMLALEIERGEKDKRWGISRIYDPYNFPMADTLSRDLSATLLAHGI